MRAPRLPPVLLAVELAGCPDISDEPKGVGDSAAPASGWVQAETTDHSERDDTSSVETGEVDSNDTAVPDTAGDSAVDDTAPPDSFAGVLALEYRPASVWAAAFDGDVDGDGQAELLLGRPTDRENAGAWTLVDSAGALATIHGSDGEMLGSDIVAGVDFNEDGVPDAAIGAPGEGSSEHGSHLSILDGATGLAAASAVATVEGDGAHRVGSAIATGDAEGDGRPDLLLGTDEGIATAALLFPGPFAGTRGVGDATAVIDTHADGTFGGGATALVDLDGDGLDDLVAGSPNMADSHGAVLIFASPATGSLGESDADVVWTGESDDSATGWSLANVGDATGDGRADLAVGSCYDDKGGHNAGAAYVVADLDPGSRSLGDAHGVRIGDSEYGGAGVAIEGCADIDGDGRAEVLVGAMTSSRVVEYGGAAFIVAGPFEGSGSLGDAEWILDAPATRAYVGNGLACGGAFTASSSASVAVSARGVETVYVYVF